MKQIISFTFGLFILGACASAPVKVLVQKDTCKEVGVSGKVLECEHVKADQK